MGAHVVSSSPFGGMNSLQDQFGMGVGAGIPAEVANVSHWRPGCLEGPFEKGSRTVESVVRV
jgi:hypothetical protein